MGESRNAATRHGESARDAQGFRAAYEALIEPLIEATIKLAAAETEQQIKQTQITALKRELADKRAGLRSLVVTPSGRIDPPRMWPMEEGMLSKSTCTCPPIRSCSAGPAPL